ncbi:MAG: dihydrodipicolinate reductase [Nitrososphaeria archaeon]|nr:dihydrodipicolinate reductase [Nitrososphaeria archaeon]
MSLRLALYGFGEIARMLARVALDRGHVVVGAVDVKPDLVGKDVGDLMGVGEMGVKVTDDPRLGLRDCEIVLHATSSFLPKIYDQLVTAIKLGKSVVSTCETLSYPYHRYPVLGRRIDSLAKSHGVTVIGTGINPGFLLDTLAITISASVPLIKRIIARRSIDAAKRRESFRKKIGVGLDPNTFSRGLGVGRYTGHIGYAESVYLIAESAGLNLTRVEECQEGVVAEERVSSNGITVEKGEIRGVRGFGIGYVGDVEKIRVEFQAVVGAPEYEEITVEGADYAVIWKSSGTPGDLGTASILISIAEKMEAMPRGLLTMADLLPFRIGLR